MPLFSIFKDSPEYTKRKHTPFRPPKTTVADIRSVIPKHLYKKSTFKGTYYFCRDILCALVLYSLATRIEGFTAAISSSLPPELLSPSAQQILLTTIKWISWGLYFHWQGIAFASLWCLGHEAGHGTLSDYSWVNTFFGFILHTFLLIPYFSWRSTHHAHHKATMSMERDENYVPRVRSDYKLPPQEKAREMDYEEIFEEMPLFTLGRMVLMQLLGMQSYLLRNSMGSPMYPPGANHFNPSSPLFKPHERRGIIASDIGLGSMFCLLAIFYNRVGFSNFVLLYVAPYILANHWIVMLTYLHHSDPTIPHYRSKEWTFLRGALATVDRPLLGWVGRYFLHNVSHDHIAHHTNSSIPFYNLPQVTQIIKSVLGDDYNYDSTNTFRALYRTFTQCCFIEDQGDIVFYKNRKGEAARIVADGVDIRDY
ncbi:delta-12 fatty acid desaturase [Macrolepiota fuliginosa MF-IS2]|uniref:Delta-12 fatty acid desaturase n=1 Tax=Macrolepiota fuliginosa MF-IS2 TaxID=1400762 RepID=A0A9P5XL11_9AGAR|nr:delta-12 fatty acid desaturase [Macrolepiota fuliginosa MF-IS2]